MNYIIAIGVFQSLIALGIIRAAKQKRPADNLLLWLTVCILVHLSIKFFIFTLVPNEEVRRQLNTFIGFAYGPLLWMFAQKLKDDRYVPFKNWYFFIPALLAGICYLGIVLNIAFTGIAPSRAIHWYNLATIWGLSLYNVVFPLAAFFTASRLSSFWEVERKLVYRICGLFAIFVLLPFFNMEFPSLFHMSEQYASILIRSIAYAALLLMSLLIFKYRVELQMILTEPQQPEETEPEVMETIIPVVEEELSIVTAELIQTETPVAGKKSVLNTEQQAAIIDKLEKLMREKKLYKDDELSLEKLAATMKTGRHHVSEALNQHLGKTFYQFVNEFRIREIIEGLDKCHKLDIQPNILALAMEAGFKSKSSFNIYFKKITGLTPTEYLKSKQESQQVHAEAEMAFG